MAHEALCDRPGNEYQMGIRDTCMTVVALTLTRGTGRDGERVRDQLTAAVADGRSGAELLRVGLHAAGRTGETGCGVEWIGTWAFQARHGSSGVDEDLATSLGLTRSIRLSWRRRPGSHVGVLYAYDERRDVYAVITDEVDRDLAHQAFQHASLGRGVKL
jgi:hypothetical protein